MSEIENQEEINTEELGEQEDAQEEEKAALETEKQQQAIVEAEEKARKTGWVPEKEFKGKNWRPANEWNERGDEYIPFIKAELRGTKEKLTGLEDENKSLKSTVKKLTTMSDKFSEDFYDKNIAELEEQELKAVEEGDTEAFQRIREQKAKIEKPEPVAEAEPEPNKQTQPIPPHPEAVKFMEANPWFNDDLQLQKYAFYVGQQLNEQNDPVAEPGQEKAFYAKVAQEVKTEFAHKFKNPKQGSSDMDESSTRGTETSETGNGAKGWEDLPAEAKQQCRKLMGEDESYTKEEYVKHYPFDDEE